MTQSEQPYLENCSTLFHTIPRKKLDVSIQDIQTKFSDDSGLLNSSGAKLLDAIQRYYDANIPVDYWFRDMHNFQGPQILADKYSAITKSVPQSYIDGIKYCLAGNWGVGKTYVVSCILKRVVESKYSGLYVNLTDIINVITSNNEEKQDARKYLMEVDFLVIDEVDQRFMGTENAADLFGRILEPIIRTRIQNKMPLLLCTNSPNVVGSFTGALKSSIESLMKVVDIVPVFGKDYRAEVKLEQT